MMIIEIISRYLLGSVCTYFNLLNQKKNLIREKGVLLKCSSFFGSINSENRR